MKTRGGPEKKAEKKIDWDSIKQRLAAATQALEDEFVPPPARLRAVLAERTRALAQPPAPVPQTGPELELFEFELDGDRYAIGMEYVLEAHALKELTPLPGVPPFVRGIVNLHGVITAVVDLKALLALPAGSPGGAGRLLLLSKDGMRFCLLADRIVGPVAVPSAAVRAPLAEGAQADFLLGMSTGRLTILDGEYLLSERMCAIS